MMCKRSLPLSDPGVLPIFPLSTCQNFFSKASTAAPSQCQFVLNALSKHSYTKKLSISLSFLRLDRGWKNKNKLKNFDQEELGI